MKRPDVPPAPIAPREIELKLEIDPADIAELTKQPLIAEVAGQTNRQVSTYYDTAGQKLRKSGIALRVREVDQRFVQTVKGDNRDSGGMFDRPEWEKEIDGPAPTPGSLSGTPVAALIARDKQDHLIPMFSAMVDRTVWTIHEGASEIEMVLDQGEIRVDDRHDVIAEVELELKRGPAGDIFSFAHRLAASTPLRLGVLAKNERGYLLRDGAGDKPVKAIAAAVAPGMTAGAAFRAIASACIRQFRLNEPLFVRDHHGGGLHQCRVSMRRLRSAFSMFAGIAADDRREALMEGLRWISGDLGEARDLDVFLTKRMPKGAVSDELRIEALAQRHETFERAIAALSSHRFRTLMLDLAEWLALGKWQMPDNPARQLRDQPVEDFAEAALDRFWRKVRKGGQNLAKIEDEARHAVRIAAKKLRYGSEFFAPLYHGARSKHRDEFIGALEHLQEHLGDLNDMVTARALADRFPGIPIQEADRAALLEAAEKAHDRLIRIGPFWR